MSPRGTLRDCGLTLFFFPFNHPLRSEERDGLSLGVLPSLAQQQEETGGFPPCPAARAGGAGQGEDQVCCEPGIWGFAQPGSYFLCVHSRPRCPAWCRDGVGRELWSSPRQPKIWVCVFAELQGERAPQLLCLQASLSPANKATGVLSTSKLLGCFLGFIT